MPDLAQHGTGRANIIQLRHNRAAHLAQLRHLYPIPGPIPEMVAERDHLVPVGDGTSVPVRIYTPTQPPSKGSPLVVMFHEGGWCMGDLTDEDLNCRMFARDLGAVCVNVDYRLAPEHVFPTGITDSYAVVQWCASTASPTSSILPANPNLGFIVGGASAGGNIAAVLCQMGRDRTLTPPLTGQYLCVPALLSTDSIPQKWRSEYRSRTESVSDPVLKFHHDGVNQAFDALKPDLTSPLFNPLLHPNLKGLPPAYFQLAGLDPLRDEGLLYERLLREENSTATKINVYDGFGHMFWTNWPEIEKSKRFVEDTLAGVRWLIEVGTTRK